MPNVFIWISNEVTATVAAEIITFTLTRVVTATHTQMHVVAATHPLAGSVPTTFTLAR